MEINFEKVPLPISNRVHVIQDEPVSVTKSNIILVTKQKQYTGTIINIGVDTKDVDHLNQLKPGVRVLFGDWAGVEFEHENIKILSMRISDIFCIID